MPLKLKDIQTFFDKDYTANKANRERASDDLVFYYVSQWDESLLNDSQLNYRGQFDIIRKAGRGIIADLRSNPVSIDFQPQDLDRKDGADLVDGLFLTDERRNTTIEAYDIASQESVVCGFGAWELFTEYESKKDGSKKQVIRRRPVWEAVNTCFWDSNAKSLDKHDATRVGLLTAYSTTGYEELVKSMTGEDVSVDYSSFYQPEESYTFPWISGQQELIYVLTFYHREMIKDKSLTILDPMSGVPSVVRESDLKRSGLYDEVMDGDFEISEEKEIERWEVRKYITSGREILNGEMNDETEEREGEVVAGEYIPVIPTYGELAQVEGGEHYEGVTRLAKDPQRLHNFEMSYLADIVSRSPRPKPIFFPEQIQGFEHMYEENGADNNYPFYYQNAKAADGTPLPPGPVAVMPEQTMPQALVASMELTRQAIDDVAPAGLPKDIADPNVSGKAVQLLNARMDKQSLVYQQNLKHSKRRDATVYASMASEVYDSPRKVTMTKPDGTQTQVEIMIEVLDEETGEMSVINDITNMDFEVFAEVGPTYTSKKDQTREELKEAAQLLDPQDPLRKNIMLELLNMMDGINSENIRKAANKEMILSGYKEPETDEEKQMVQQAQEAAAQQQEQPDPNMVFAQAEQAKADAQMAREQRMTQEGQMRQQIDQQKMQIEQYKLQTQAMNDQTENQIDQFNAETGRYSAQVSAKTAGVNAELTTMKTQGQIIDNQIKKISPFRPRVNG